MSAIDSHAHAFPDELAERAILKLQSDSDWLAVGDGTIGGLLRSMDAADIDVTLTCAIATRPGQAKGILKWCGKIRSDRIDPLPSVHPSDRKATKWIKRIAEAGFVGIKLHPMYQDFEADDPRTDEIYAAVAEHGLIVAIHCGYDISFGPDDDRASPERIRNVIDRHPDLKLIATHMGGWRAWEQVERVLIGRDVYLETSFSLRELGAERAAELIRRHGVEKVMFGTDWPWRDQAEEKKLLESLPLPKKQIRQLFYSNAAKLLGY